MNLKSEPVVVLRIITRLNVGGPAKQIQSLLKNLNKSEFRQILVMGSVLDSELLSTEVDFNDVEVIQIPELGRSIHLWSDFIAFFKIVRVIHNHRPQIVHTHLAKAGLLGRLASFVCRTPVRIHTFHGHLLTGYFNGIRLRTYILTERLLSKTTTFSVVVGEGVRQDLIEQKMVEEKKSISIPPGISISEPLSKSLARNLLDISTEQFVITFVGRLVPVKRLDRFLNIVNQLGSQIPNLTALIVGAGDNSLDRNENPRELGDTRFLGWRTDMTVIYSASDVVVLTSDNEGMPISLIEAGLYSLPSVASDVGSVREIVEDGLTGFVVEAEDEREYTVRIVELAASPSLRENIGKAAFEKCNASFTPMALANKHKDLYVSLLKESERT